MKNPAILKYMIGNASVNPKLQHSFLWLNCWLFLRRFELRLGQIPIPKEKMVSNFQTVRSCYAYIGTISTDKNNNNNFGPALSILYERIILLFTGYKSESFFYSWDCSSVIVTVQNRYTKRCYLLRLQAFKLAPKESPAFGNSLFDRCRKARK